MPTVAIDPRGGGPGARALIAELRRFDGLRAPIWRPWSPLFPPRAVPALGGAPPARAGPGARGAPAGGARRVPGRRDAHRRDERRDAARGRARALPVAGGDA